MDRTRKLLIIGGTGFERRAEDVRIDCLGWDRLGEVANVSDCDGVLINLLCLEKVHEVDWKLFSSKLNQGSMMEVVLHGGDIIVLGNPRFTAPPSQQYRAYKFLEWTGMEFHWDPRPGDTKVYSEEQATASWRRYLDNLTRWHYSLRACKGDAQRLPRPVSAPMGEEYSLSVDQEDFCRTRYGQALAFQLRFSATWSWKDKRGGSQQKTSRLGGLVFLPESDLAEHESLALVLQEGFGVELSVPEPQWLADEKAPGQKEVDDRIEDIKKQVAALREQFLSAEAERDSIRQPLALLYQRGPALENAVRDVLRRLGAEEEPGQPGKEDGWIAVQVDGDTREGVLEVKGTQKPQFTKQGLRQLSEWVRLGKYNRGNEYKGLYFGSNATEDPPNQRPKPFTEDFEKTARLEAFAAMTTCDLYAIYCLDVMGKLDRQEFWRRLFNTVGVFDASEYHQALKGKDEGG